MQQYACSQPSLLKAFSQLDETKPAGDFNPDQTIVSISYFSLIAFLSQTSPQDLLLFGQS